MVLWLAWVGCCGSSPHDAVMPYRLLQASAQCTQCSALLCSPPALVGVQVRPHIYRRARTCMPCLISFFGCTAAQWSHKPTTSALHHSGCPPFYLHTCLPCPHVKLLGLLGVTATTTPRRTLRHAAGVCVFRHDHVLVGDSLACGGVLRTTNFHQSPHLNRTAQRFVGCSWQANKKKKILLACSQTPTFCSFTYKNYHHHHHHAVLLRSKVVRLTPTSRFEQTLHSAPPRHRAAAAVVVANARCRLVVSRCASHFRSWVEGKQSASSFRYGFGKVLSAAFTV